ncbi:ABC transporter ATP-binding protein [Mucilaginibacter arboris]|uniref:ATP-binding cassette domain-containing protein n=1 Tax=Mucilaginibacter arboris TaxID=2682090 RepID=A0A7K1STG3_9SPHI|nr:ABC transporter ATP-binding protein [Mucilaginibacter arboris]MVN20596.1 ATP-binding cassette domain-containing protein [Mucilaginibacter arboris]
MTESMPFLEVKNVTKLFAGEKISGVKNISLSIAEGKITAIIGRSGSGKSTLLNLIYGLIDPDAGRITFLGERVWGPAEKLIPGHDQMKMVTQQSDHLNHYAKVWDNVASLLPNTNLTYKSAKTTEVLQQLRLLDLKERRVADLSGGERQRVSIARALVANPKVLLLDEPFNQVDASFRDNLQQDIREIVRQTGLTVIMVSHDPQEVLSLADELVVLKDGEVVEAGNPQQLYQQPENLYTATLLANGTVFNGIKAASLGIATKKKTIMVYAEGFYIDKNSIENLCTIEAVLFKGFYEELVLNNGTVKFKTINLNVGAYQTGDRVSVTIKQFLTFEEGLA